MNKKLLTLSLVCVTGALIITANPRTVMAFEDGVAGYTLDKDISGTNNSTNGTSATNLSVSDIPIPGYKDLCIADVDTNLLIRQEPNENSKILGKLPKNAGCDRLESNKDGWTKISAETSSGEILIGYVKSEYLIVGSEATKLGREIGNYVATANTNGDNLNIREEASITSQKIDTIAKGEELLLIDANINTNDPQYPNWVKVSLDSDTEEGSEGSYGYAAKNLVTISFQLIHALSMQEIQFGAGVSQTRVNLVNNAKDHLGESYVWGGTRLGHGVDCSGFTQALYDLMGYNIPRTSREQARSGDVISASELKPGDLVFYGSKSYINHVAMYIGGGRVIHASNHRDGIKISNMYYRTPVKCVRYIHD